MRVSIRSREVEKANSHDSLTKVEASRQSPCGVIEGIGDHFRGQRTTPLVKIVKMVTPFLPFGDGVTLIAQLHESFQANVSQTAPVDLFNLLVEVVSQ